MSSTVFILDGFPKPPDVPSLGGGPGSTGGGGKAAAAAAAAALSAAMRACIHAAQVYTQYGRVQPCTY